MYLRDASALVEMLCDKVYFFMKCINIFIGRLLIIPFERIASAVMAQAFAVGEMEIKRNVVSLRIVGILDCLDEIRFIDFFEIVGWGITGVSRCLNIVFINYFLVHCIRNKMTESM